MTFDLQIYLIAFAMWLAHWPMIIAAAFTLEPLIKGIKQCLQISN